MRLHTLVALTAKANKPNQFLNGAADVSIYFYATVFT